jgi:OmpA-OmpF porin, OOP family
MRATAIGLGLLLLAWTSPAKADFPSSEPYVGLFGGYTLTLDNWDLGKNAEVDTYEPESSFVFGGRFGWQLGQLALELGVGYLPLGYSDDTSESALIYTVDALYHLKRGNVSPYLLLGVGGYHVLGDAPGADFDPQFQAGVGVRALVTPFLALRGEGRFILTDGRPVEPNLEFSVGVDIFLGGAKKIIPKILDSDGDGLSDEDDKCKLEPGPASTGGCPDADGDGIIDADDKCPQVAGKAELGGCPDTDGDGITDADDKCPQTAGKAELGGCPDTDGDGIIDADDKCPQVAGKAELGGCPDGDGDGITDADDKCPTEAGKPALQGCPDRDGDGIADADDKCPDQAGVPAEQGCLPAAVAKFTGAIKGIQFQINSAKITAGSFPTLDAAIAVLQQYPTLRLRIEGHTDNSGKPDLNLQLSQDRAESVKTYMVSKGVDVARIDAVGLGDTKPTADNKTNAGRIQNRRIEFVIIGQ